MSAPSIVNTESAHRYELSVDGKLAAWAEYNLIQDAVMFTHTEVLPAHEGQGLGSSLAKFALDDVRSRGLGVVPACQFIAGYIRRHGEYLELVPERFRRAYQL
jgi:hypothetical protein